MITIRTRDHAAQVLAHLRVGQGLTRRDLADRLFVSAKTVGNRELGTAGLAIDAMIDTAHALGFAVALLPARTPSRRPTGTGWPA